MHISYDLKMWCEHVHNLIILEFSFPFYHKHDPMEKEVNQVAQQWFHNHFGNIVIHESFDKISKKNFLTF